MSPSRNPKCRIANLSNLVMIREGSDILLGSTYCLSSLLFIHKHKSKGKEKKRDNKRKMSLESPTHQKTRKSVQELAIWMFGWSESYFLTFDFFEEYFQKKKVLNLLFCQLSYKTFNYFNWVIRLFTFYQLSPSSQFWLKITNVKTSRFMWYDQR